MTAPDPLAVIEEYHTGFPGRRHSPDCTVCAALASLKHEREERDRLRESLREALLTARGDLLWQANYAGPDGRAEAFEAIDRIDAALDGEQEGK